MMVDEISREIRSYRLSSVDEPKALYIGAWKWSALISEKECLNHLSMNASNRAIFDGIPVFVVSSDPHHLRVI